MISNKKIFDQNWKQKLQPFTKIIIKIQNFHFLVKWFVQKTTETYKHSIYLKHGEVKGNGYCNWWSCHSNRNSLTIVAWEVHQKIHKNPFLIENTVIYLEETVEENGGIITKHTTARMLKKTISKKRRYTYIRSSIIWICFLWEVYFDIIKINSSSDIL